MPLPTNAASLARFSLWVAAQSDAVFDDYRHRLNRSLAAQQSDQLTQRAILELMEEIFGKALAVLDGVDVRYERSRRSSAADRR